METQYYKDIKNKRIAIFGITPPPLGGVSVHIQRITKKFKENGNQVYHFKTEFRGRKYLLAPYLIYVFLFLFWHKIIWRKIDILYYHSTCLPNSITELYFISFFKKILNFKTVLVEHNCRHMYKRNKKELSRLTKILKTIEQLVFIGNSNYQSYAENSINLSNCPIYSIEPAFLPPDISQEQKIISSYPKDINNFIKRHTPVFLANASNLYLLNQKDIYGLDKSIYILPRLKKSYPKIGLIFAISKITDKNHFEKIKKEIKINKLENNVFFIIGQHEIWPIFKDIDLFLRPTLSDGDSISIQEALFFNIPVIASNVCKRPYKVITFDVHSEKDFINKIKSCIKKNHETI
ncbi:glycosyltransferase [Candidatus Dependentiae bacterium]